MKLLEDSYFYLYSLPIPVETSLKLRVREKLEANLDSCISPLAIYLQGNNNINLSKWGLDYYLDNLDESSQFPLVVL